MYRQAGADVEMKQKQCVVVVTGVQDCCKALALCVEEEGGLLSVGCECILILF